MELTPTFTLQFHGQQEANEFVSLLKDCREAVNKLAILTPAKPMPEFLTKTQARDYLGGISQPTFDKLVEKQVIAAYRVSEGRVVYFLPELREYVLKQK